MSDKNNYKHWIKTLADLQGGRPFFSDQLPGSLELLGRLVETYQPTQIIEVGTNFGLSLRCWKEAAPTTPITAIDASFNPLKLSQTVLPFDTAGITFIEKYAHDVVLESLWPKPDATKVYQDRVLLYVDIHSDHTHIFDAIPNLPPSSVVVFDDMWRSDTALDTKEAQQKFFQDVVFFQVDQTAPMSIMPQCYSDYWRGGGFYGFDESRHICNWAAKNKVTLHWEPGVKVVWAQWPQDRGE